MFIDCAKLGALLLGYEILNKILTYVYYGIVASVNGGGFYMLPSDSVAFLRAHQEISRSTVFSMGANLFVVCISATVTLITARLILKARLSEMIKPHKQHFPQAFKWMPLCMLANVMISLVINILKSYFAAYGVTIPENDFTIVSPTTAAIVMQFVYVIVVGPIVEELIFRGLILTLLKPYGSGVAIFFSAFCFGIMHGNIPQAASAFGSALIMAAIALKCGSVIPTILIHIFNNMMASYSDFSAVMNWPYADEIQMAIQIILMFAGVFVLLVFGKQLLDLKGKPCAMTFGQRMAAAFSNPLLLSFIAYELYFMIKTIINAN